MLVLSRGPQDKVFFPKLGICVEVLRIANRQVRLGITAPKDVKIARDAEYAAQLELSAVDESLGGPDARERMASANKLVQEAARCLSANQSAEAMKLLNLALSEFDMLENDAQDADSLQETKAKYNALHRILLVDENERSRQRLAQVLRLKGFEVTEANDTLRAIYRLSSQEPLDAMLIDLSEPDDHSAMTLQHVSSFDSLSYLPIYAMAISKQDASRFTTGDRIAEWFAKPIDPMDIAERLRQSFLDHA